MAGRSRPADLAHPRRLPLWGGWLVVTALTFSFMAGIFHAYYTVALAPAIGALIGMGSTHLWREWLMWRAAGPLLAALVGGSALWAWQLLGRSGDFLPWLRALVLVVGALAALALLVESALARSEGWGGGRMAGPAASVIAGAGLVVVLAGPTAYAVQTSGTAHTGAIPTAGPNVTGGRFGPGGGPGGMRGGTFGGPGAGGLGQLPNGWQPPGFGTGQFGQQGAGTGLGGMGRGTGGGMGGLLDATTPSSELVQALQADASPYTWVAATVGANNAGGVPAGER